MLDGVEGDGVGEVGERGVGAAAGADGHLVLLEVEVVGGLLEVAQEKIVGGTVFFGETFGGDGLDAGEVGRVDVVAALDGGEGVVAELVVVAVVADSGGEGGGKLEVGLPGLGEESVLRGETGGGVVGGGGLREDGGAEDEGGGQG